MVVSALIATGLFALEQPASAAPGQPFPTLESPYTEAVFGTAPAFLGGVAFAPNGDVWADTCGFDSSPMYLFQKSTSTFVHGTTVHPSTEVPSNAGCGLTDHPDGHIYSNTDLGVAQLDASTGAPLATFGPPGNALGITVDPRTNDLIYVGQDCRFTATCTIEDVNPQTHQAHAFATLPSSTASYVDGVTFDPTGTYLLLSTRAPSYALTILDRTGNVVQQVAMGDEPDGISFHATSPQFVVTNNTDGTMTRFDFPGGNLKGTPTLSTFASGGYRGDLSLVGSDGCIYLTQAGTNYLDGSTSSDNSLVTICPGFAPSPGTPPAAGPVYVALGDSYSSGEGAPPFEDGTNYPPAVQQENTYTYGTNATGCHRSLTNYAKLFAGTIDPGTSTTLVDRTCSGAEIGAAVSPDKGPIIPPDPLTGVPSQVTQAEQRLAANFGLGPSDVNVVSATMGGNDAGFGDLISACLIPNLAKVLFAQYDNVPGEVEFLVSHFASCQNIDSLLFHTGSKIAKLQGIEANAEGFLTGEFPNASVYQLTYPGIVPSTSDFGGDNCGGVLRSDIKYVRGKVQSIDDAIRSAGAATSQFAPNFHIVDVQNAFGPNALCPADPSQALATGISETALQNTVAGLLTPGSQSRQLLDNLSNSYQSLRDCVLLSGLTAFLFCRGDYDNVKTALSNLEAFFTGPEINKLVASLAPGQTEQQRFDDSRFFFHPNAVGQGIMACNLDAAYHGNPQSECAPNLNGVLTYLFDGTSLTSMAPVTLTPGAPVPFKFNGFDPGSPVTVEVHSAGIPLGSFTADSTGTVAGSLAIPANLSPGVHQIEFAGTNNTSPRSIDVLISVPGRPVGGSDYGMYFCCFPNDSQVDVNIGGLDWGAQPTDEDGGVFVTFPMPDPAKPGTLTVTATGTTSGQTQSRTLDPAPSSAAVWARNPSPSAVTVTGARNTFGWLHSDGGVSVSGAQNSLTGGVEMAGGFNLTGAHNTVSPAPVTTPPGGSPLSVDMAAYAPGSPLARSLGSGYTAIPAASCSNGAWSPAPSAIPAGVVYVPCGVTLDGSGAAVTATIVADGPLTISGTGWSLAPAFQGLGLAAASFTLSGTSNTFTGAVWAAGPFVASGSSNTFGCGAYADTVRLSGAKNSFSACPSG